MKRQAALGMAALLVAGLAATMAAAQAPSAVQGPLGKPDAPAASPSRATSPTAKPAKRSRRHAAVPAADLPRGADPSPETPRPPPTSRAERAARSNAADPVSLGFKWQGSNDTAEKTRVQNYNGDAAGTGAAVGLKLHF